MHSPFVDIIQDKDFGQIAEKVLDNKRISDSEALFLFEKAPLGLLGFLAENRKKFHSGKYVFFNRNFHLEPSNICVNHCRFCSYRRNVGEPGCWDESVEALVEKAKQFRGKAVTEVHIVGAVHPHKSFQYYLEIVSEIKKVLPGIVVKAYSAVELAAMFDKEGISDEVGLQKLKEAGLQTIPGGGAEIFDPEIRKRICPEKADADRWLKIHEAAHHAGISTNATILYGHLENYTHRVSHMNRLRELQDKTGGFNCFIPLKFRNQHNELSGLKECSLTEDLKNYAISRIFLDNFKHIKAYWPAMGQQSAALSLAFGVDDLDGTIDDTTKIYSMAGAEDQNPSMSSENLTQLIKNEGKIAVERNSFYHSLHIFE